MRNISGLEMVARLSPSKQSKFIKFTKQLFYTRMKKLWPSGRSFLTVRKVPLIKFARPFPKGKGLRKRLFKKLGQRLTQFLNPVTLKNLILIPNRSDKRFLIQDQRKKVSISRPKI